MPRTLPVLDRPIACTFKTSDTLLATNLTPRPVLCRVRFRLRVNGTEIGISGGRRTGCKTLVVGADKVVQVGKKAGLSKDESEEMKQEETSVREVHFLVRDEDEDSELWTGQIDGTN